jgi:UDP-N-acetylglucosamine--N-acetylmuramyl-(pentapeptide) pyrophosphoryl-undecaprenol N-acetylglucosamine transferase
VPDTDLEFDVSIVVPVGAFDDAAAVQLRAIGELDRGDLQIELILSSNSGRPADEAQLRAATAADWPTPVTIIDSSSARGAAHARNAGAAVARGRVLAFCDADDVVDKDWLVRIVEALDRADAVSGHLVELVDRESDRGLRPPATPDGLPTFLGVPYLLSGNLAMPTTLFRRLGGFDTDLIRCEDTALSWKMIENGHSIGYEPTAVVHYRMRSGLWLMMRQHFMYGRGAAQVLVRYGVPTSYRQDDRRVGLMKPNAQPGGRGSYVRFLRRASNAAGRATGIIEERFVRRLPRTGLQLAGNTASTATATTAVGVVDPPAASPGSRLLFVADAGGHLLEGWIMRELLYDGLDTTWYTADTVMSRSLLRDEHTEFAKRRVLPRRPDLAAREFFIAFGSLRRWKPDLVVSTGSAVALPWLIAAVMQRRRAVFHESAARYRDLSLTGKLIDLVPGIERYTQTPIERRRWKQSRSTFELADRVRSTAPATTDFTTRRVFVTVGTYEYPFQRLFRRVEQIVPADWTIVWQLGHAAGYVPARGEIHAFLPYEQMIDEMRGADIVITHAGIGSVLSAVQAGRLPTVVPRRVAHGEIADDHQLEVLDYLRSYGIAALDDVDDLDAALFGSA